MDHLPLRFGLTMWSHNHWQQTFYGRGTKNQQRLEKYAQVFHTVEGNTTFYATPTLNTVKNWAASVGEQFRFTFKLPQAITHQRMLKNCHSELNDFINIMSPLHELIGQWSIQLPASFGPEHLDSLYTFALYFPKTLISVSKFATQNSSAKVTQKNGLIIGLSNTNTIAPSWTAAPFFPQSLTLSPSWMLKKESRKSPSYQFPQSSKTHDSFYPVIQR